MPKQVNILGAGPSGLTAAITLAKHNYEVHVYEKRKTCGARFKGDLQGLENWTSKTDIVDEFKSFGLEINFDCDPFARMSAVDANLNVTTYETAHPLFYLVKRGTETSTLDTGLKEQALNLGVQIHFENTIPEIETDIVATGPNSKKMFALDKGIIFETDMPDVAYGMLNNNNSYLGYSYLLVTKGYGCLCTVLFDRLPEIHTQFESVKEDFIKLTGVTIKNPRNVGGFTNFLHQSHYNQNNRLYVGEAAGLQDLLWGFGIRHAVRSGYLAATCLMENKNYAKVAQDTFSNGLRTTVVNRFLWEYMGNSGYSLFLKMGKRSKNAQQFLHNFFQYSPLKRIAFPLALWNLKRRYQFLSKSNSNRRQNNLQKVT